MTSVLLRILRTTAIEPGNSYTPNLLAGTTPESVSAAATATAAQPPEVVTTHVSGGEAAGPASPAAAAPPAVEESSASTPQAGTDNRTITALEQEGWKLEPLPTK